MSFGTFHWRTIFFVPKKVAWRLRVIAHNNFNETFYARELLRLSHNIFLIICCTVEKISINSVLAFVVIQALKVPMKFCNKGMKTRRRKVKNSLFVEKTILKISTWKKELYKKDAFEFIWKHTQKIWKFEALLRIYIFIKLKIAYSKSLPPFFTI